MGLFSSFLDPIFGDVDKISTSGAFPGIGELGSDFSDFLDRRLNQDPSQSDEFRLGRESIRDFAGGVAGAQRQRLGNAANTGGFLDSGSVTRGLSEIDRGELRATSAATRDLLMSLFERQTEGILPFLAAGANERLGGATTNVGIAQADRNFGMDFFNDTFEFGD